MVLRQKSKYSRVVINLLVALAISLVVNFSYLLLLVVQPEPSNPQNRGRKELMIEREGWLQVDPNGHGYLLIPQASTIDSLYLTNRFISWWQLSDGDLLRVRAEQVEVGYPRVKSVLERNGVVYDEAMLYHRPSQGLLIAVQIVYYLALAFTLVTLMTARADRSGYATLFLFKRMALAVLVAVALYMVAPVQVWRTGELVPNFASSQPIDYLLLLRVTFTLVVSILYAYLYSLLHKSQRIALENEHLKNENLTSRYNMLVSQVNPHFLFNSFNSLAMLVREGKTEASLTYIDRLSYAFRYILQNGQTPLVCLADELKFAEAYSYLFKTRYADKLFFDIRVEESMLDYQLPALSLQPLMGNAVKHNMITSHMPLHVSIRTEGEYLVIENPFRPKLDPEPGMGIGLENLKNRWELITSQPIEIIRSEELFAVRLPLQKPTKR